MHVFVSGRVSLDLAGTLQWRRDEPRDLLPDGPSVAGWVVEAGLLSDLPRVSDGQAADARHLRELIYAAVRVDEPRHTAAAELQAFADVPPVRPTLTRDLRLRRQGDLGAALSTVARDALELIGSAQLERVRECDRPECTRLFIDNSRGKPRRWCGMAECGNRVKAANYRRRQRQRQG